MKVSFLCENKASSYGIYQIIYAFNIANHSSVVLQLQILFNPQFQNIYMLKTICVTSSGFSMDRLLYKETKLHISGLCYLMTITATTWLYVKPSMPSGDLDCASTGPTRILLLTSSRLPSSLCYHLEWSAHSSQSL